MLFFSIIAATDGHCPYVCTVRHISMHGGVYISCHVVVRMRYQRINKSHHFMKRNKEEHRIN